MKLNTKVCGILSLAVLAGCGSLEPLRKQSDSERLAMFEQLSGRYHVIDARKNNFKFSQIQLSMADTNGSATLTTHSGEEYRFKLSKCEIANQSQAGNTGKPITSIEELTRCDIVSDYKYAQIYVGKVKNDYIVSDQAVIGMFDPIVINGGYLITLQIGPGSRVILNTSK